MKNIYLILGLILFSTYQVSANQLIIIANKSNPNTSISAKEAKTLYLKKIKSKWPQSGEAIVPVSINGNNDVKNAFNDKVLGMSENDVNRHFVQLQYSSAAKPPAKVSSEADLIQYVASNPGAIGYALKGSTLPANVIVICEIP